MLKGIRPGIVVIVLVIGLVAIFGGQFVVKYFYMEKPFKEEVLSIKGIKDVEVQDVGDVQKVLLTIDSKVDLEAAYDQVNSLAKANIKGPFVLEVKSDDASQQVKAVYNQMHFAIYEGIARGRFTEMASRVKEIGAANKVDDLKIEVDNQNVYLTMVKDNEVFGKIVPRLSEKVALYTNTDEGGGSQW